jgi:hypothetical protein
MCHREWVPFIFTDIGFIRAQVSCFTGATLFFLSRAGIITRINSSG